LALTPACWGKNGAPLALTPACWGKNGAPLALTPVTSILMADKSNFFN